MPFLPIATRELRQSARRPKTYWNRLAAAGLAALFTLGVLSPSFQGLAKPTERGFLLFYILSAAAFLYALFSGAYLTADSLSEEKRDGTLGLLFLTDLKGYDVVFGKLLATSLNAFYALVGTLPLLAVPLLIGGVTAGEFWRMTIVLLNTLFFSLTVGIAVSAISRHGRRAWVATIGLILSITGLPWLEVNYATPLISAAGSLSVLFSPVYAGVLVFDGKITGDFWSSIGLTHLLAWGFLAFASLVLPVTWQESAPNRHLARLKLRWQEWTLGTIAQRQKDREKWMLENPVLWLAKRERHRRAFFWGFMGFFALGWALGYVWLESFWIRGEVLFATATVLHLILKVWIALEVSRRLSEDKRTGALELLLVAPLRLSEILNGILAAIRRQFLVPIMLVLGVDMFLLMFGLRATTMPGGPTVLALTFLVTVGMFLADVYTLAWVGLWQGLSAKNSSQAFVRSVISVMVLPWFYFCLLAGMITFFSRGEPGVGLLIACWFAVSYVTDLVLCARAMRRLTEDFREVAVQISETPKTFWPWRGKKAPAIPANQDGFVAIETTP